MSKYGMWIDADKCIGCQACFVACKEENQVLPGVQWNHLERREHPEPLIIDYFRVSCMHCDDPACAKVCPVKAVFIGPHGEVLVDSSKCVACHACEMACPYGAPKFADPTRISYFGSRMPLAQKPKTSWTGRIPGKAEHCTLCVHRTSEGRSPACVEVCSTGALTLVDYDALTPEQQKNLQKAQIMGPNRTKPKLRFFSSNTNFGELTIKA